MAFDHVPEEPRVPLTRIRPAAMRSRLHVRVRSLSRSVVGTFEALTGRRTLPSRA
jgi:hypothetical protein